MQQARGTTGGGSSSPLERKYFTRPITPVPSSLSAHSDMLQAAAPGLAVVTPGHAYDAAAVAAANAVPAGSDGRFGRHFGLFG